MGLLFGLVRDYKTLRFFFSEVEHNTHSSVLFLTAEMINVTI